MRSKTSFFNKSLFFKTVTRFWPIWFFYLAVWFVAMPLVLNASMSWSISAVSIQSAVLSIAHTGGLIVGGIFAVFAAMAVWSFMYSARSMSGTACLPIRREGVFLSVTLAGLLPMLAVNVLIFLLCIGVQALRGFVDVGLLAQWLAIVSMQLVFFYGFSVFCAQLTGSILVLPVVYAVLNFTAFVVESLVQQLFNIFIYGANVGGDGLVLSFLSPPIEMFLRTNVQGVTAYNQVKGYYETVSYYFSGWGTLAIYAVVGIALAVCALLLYKRRRMESAGDVVAVRVLKPVFKYCMTFGCAVCIGYLLYAVCQIDSGTSGGQVPVLLLFMLIGAFIGYFASEMLIRKSFRVWRGHWLGIGVSALVIVSLMLAAEFDLFGYERRIPDVSNVESVTVLSSPGDLVTLSQEENVQALTELHRSVVWHKRQYEAYDGLSYEEGRRFSIMAIEYHMEDGSTMSRRYQLWYNIDDKPTQDDVRELQEIINTKEAILQRKETAFGFTADTIFSGYIQAKQYADDYSYTDTDYITDVPVPMTGDGSDDQYLSWEFTPEELSDLFNNCIVPDINDGTLGRIWLFPDEEYERSVYSAYISIDARTMDKSEYNIPNNYVYDYFHTTPTIYSVRTNQWLIEHGVTLHTIAEVGE